MNFKNIEKLSQKQMESLGATFPEHNEYITECAGFVPLEVKLRRFVESGQLMQFHQEEFTSSDYREMYFSPDFEINPEDDLEEIQDKLVARNQFAESLIMERRKNQTLETKSPKSPPAGSQTEEIQTSEPKDVPDQKA